MFQGQKKKPIPTAIRDKSIREDIIQNLVRSRKNIVGGNEQDALLFLDRVLSEIDPCWRTSRA